MKETADDAISDEQKSKELSKENEDKQTINKGLQDHFPKLDKIHVFSY